MWASSELSADVCRCRHVVQGLLKNIKIMLKLHIHLYYNFHHYLCPKGPPGTSKRTPRDLQKTSKGNPRDLQGTTEGPPRNLWRTSKGPLRDLRGTSKDLQGLPWYLKGPLRDLWGTFRDLHGLPGKSRNFQGNLGTSRDYQGLSGTSRDPQECQGRFLEIFRKLDSFKEFEGFFRSWPHEGKG